MICCLSIFQIVSLSRDKCLSTEARTRFLVRPDVFRKVDELQRMADEVERRICDQGVPAKEKEEGAASAERPMETETEEGPAKTTAEPSAGMRLDAPATAPAE